MEEQERNNINHSALPDRKEKTLRLSYCPDLKHELADAVDFVLGKLKFYPTEKFSPTPDLKDGLILLKGQNNEYLTLDIKLIEASAELKYITFYTNDCLRDYHKYTLAGVEFLSRPEYSKLGLRVDFLGNKQQTYSLLEQRIYTTS